MATVVYGVDVQALIDLPDPEVLCNEQVTAAYACARRWLTPSGALAELGEIQQYDSIDVRDWLGQRFDFADVATLNDLQQQATAVLLDEVTVKAANVIVTGPTALAPTAPLTLTAQIQGATGPFQMVLTTNGVTAQLLLPGQT